ncbi:MAG: lasso peptide biosynthesis B2 protein [Gammaproteobacteria bacterium]|nr:lasso peptide biosynthesis B2 protein [Gammaproteobacteria bacterium]
MWIPLEGIKPLTKAKRCFWAFEILISLALAKIFVCFFPLKRFSRYLGAPYTEALATIPPSPIALQRVARGILGVAKFLPWKSVCLDQAMAAQWILSRRSVPSTLYLGMRKSTQKKEGYDAHAWVLAGRHPVIGYCPEDKFVVVGSYANLAG